MTCQDTPECLTKDPSITICRKISVWMSAISPPKKKTPLSWSCLSYAPLRSHETPFDVQRDVPRSPPPAQQQTQRTRTRRRTANSITARGLLKISCTPGRVCDCGVQNLHGLGFVLRFQCSPVDVVIWALWVPAGMIRASCGCIDCST